MGQKTTRTSFDFDKAVMADEIRLADTKAKLAALEEQKEALLREEEETQKRKEENDEARKTVLFAEQREQRQQLCKSSIDAHIIRGMRESTINNHELRGSIEILARKEGTDQDVRNLSLGIVAEILAPDREFLHNLANKIITQNSDDNDNIVSAFTSSNIKRERGISVDHICAVTEGQPIEQPVATPKPKSKFSIIDDTPFEIGLPSSSPITVLQQPVGGCKVGGLVDIEGAFRGTVLLGEAESEIKDDKTLVAGVEDNDPNSSYLPTPKSIKRTSLVQIEEEMFNTREHSISSSVTNPLYSGLNDDDSTIDEPNPNSVDIQSPVHDRGSVKVTKDKRAREIESVDPQTSATPRLKRAKPTISPIITTFQERIESLAESGDLGRTEFQCSSCGKLPDDPKLNQCTHLYCSDCLKVARKRKICVRDGCIEALQGRPASIKLQDLTALMNKHGLSTEEGK